MYEPKLENDNLVKTRPSITLPWWYCCGFHRQNNQTKDESRHGLFTKAKSSILCDIKTSFFISINISHDILICSVRWFGQWPLDTWTRLYKFNEIFETCVTYVPMFKRSWYGTVFNFNFWLIFRLCTLSRAPSEFNVIKWLHFIRLFFFCREQRRLRIEIWYDYIVRINRRKSISIFCCEFFFLFSVYSNCKKFKW